MRGPGFVARAIGVVLMILGGVAGLRSRARAQGRRLEGIATPPTAVAATPAAV